MSAEQVSSIPPEAMGFQATRPFWNDELITPFKGYDNASLAVQQLLETIPTEQLGHLRQTGILERILARCPNQEYRSHTGMLAEAYGTGERIKKGLPPKWSEYTNHYLTHIRNERAFSTNSLRKNTAGNEFYADHDPGLVETARLLAIAGSQEHMPAYSVGRDGRILPNAPVERSIYAAHIITLATGMSENPGSYVPDQKFAYAHFEPSQFYDDIIQQIALYRSKGPENKMPIEQLVLELSQQDPQFSLIRGTDMQEQVRKINAILKAMDTYDEVFYPVANEEALAN